MLWKYYYYDINSIDDAVDCRKGVMMRLTAGRDSTAPAAVVFAEGAGETAIERAGRRN